MIDTSYASIEEILREVAEGIRPPERLTVSQAAEKYRYVNNPGSYVGYWDNKVASYLVEPMDILTSDDYQSMIFVGPAQCGKTDMLMNWIVHSAVCDPADMMVVNTAMNSARDFSRRRVDRLFRHSPEVKARLLDGGHGDNVMDKTFKTGMYLTMSWPSITELSGKPIPRLWLTDYDRFEMDIDGEGSPFDLSKKRATTFGRFGMTVAESSPGFLITDPRYLPKHKHEAPPTEGICALYNRGDRRRFYWRCHHCKNAFEPEFSYLVYPQSEDLLESAEAAYMQCPLCAKPITHNASKDQPGKQEYNFNGRWVKQGQFLLPDGHIEGVGIRSDTASFWLKGVCATFASWKILVHNYLKAEEEFERTGSQEALKTTVNTDQGMPYAQRSSSEGILPEVLKSRAEDLGLQVVPEDVRFLIATVDVQRRRFAVQITGFDSQKDMYLIDRFDLTKSKRLDDEGDPWPLDPAAYPEDWHVLIDAVLEKSYPLSDKSGRRMKIRLTGSDSGGKEGVTVNAYNFYRYLRKTTEEGFDPNLFRRFQLIKGDDRKGAPRVQLAYPDSERKDRHAGARGEIPVMFIHSNQVKDWLAKILLRSDPKGGFFHFPDWLADDYYIEMTAEIRSEKGWENPKKARNEAWDLSYYALGLSVSQHIGIDHINWAKPPAWAEVWDKNIMVFDANKDPKFKEKEKPKLEDLATLLT